MAAQQSARTIGWLRALQGRVVSSSAAPDANNKNKRNRLMNSETPAGGPRCRRCDGTVYRTERSFVQRCFSSPLALNRYRCDWCGTTQWNRASGRSLTGRVLGLVVLLAVGSVLVVMLAR